MSGKRVVLDSNVYISAFLFGGRPRVLVERLVSGQVHGAISVALLDEVRDVLMRPKFGLTDEAVMELMVELQDLCDIVSPKERVTAVKDDPDDNRVLECASAANAQMIISGDAHLLALGTWRGIPIRSPAESLAALGWDEKAE